MRLLSLLPMLCLPVLAPAADLAKVDRTLRKEPAYRGKPRYCLLVFGPEARTRVWLVLDDEALYVDRDASGDLTEAGKRVPLPPLQSIIADGFAKARDIRAGDIRDGRLTHTRLLVHQLQIDPACNGTNESARRVQQEFAAAPHGETFTVAVEAELRSGHGRVRVDACLDEHGFLAFADCARDAPVINVDGPLRLSLPGHPVLMRGDKPTDLYVLCGSAGLGPGTFAAVRYFYPDPNGTWGQFPPSGCRPVAQVEFPGPGRLSTTISLRPCFVRKGYDTADFEGPLPVPKEAGKGVARVTLSLPDWPEGKVVPKTFEVPIAEP